MPWRTMYSSIFEEAPFFDSNIVMLNRSRPVQESRLCDLVIDIETAQKNLEDGNLEAQEFFRILAEVADQQAKVAGQSSQVVIELRIGEKLSRGRRVVVELGGRGSKIRTRVLELVVERVVGFELAE